jgi:hypothetical protein
MRIVLSICVLDIMNTVFSQNKKEQIEALNFSLDSLNTILANERTVVQER